MKMKNETGPNGYMQYKKLLLMMLLSFVAMYILMYSMVNTFSNVIPNIDQIYMAGLMTMPMLIIELTVMGGMYMKKKLNAAMIVMGSTALIVFFLFIRFQSGVGDKQFLKAMIPHHAAAILMVEQSKITDPEIKKLGNEITSSQQKEIDFMKAKIKSLDNK